MNIQWVTWLHDNYLISTPFSGDCLLHANGTLYCDCEDTYENASYTGERCQTETCPHTDQGICNDRGTCLENICYCDPGWAGDNCTETNCDLGNNDLMCSGMNNIAIKKLEIRYISIIQTNYSCLLSFFKTHTFLMDFTIVITFLTLWFRNFFIYEIESKLAPFGKLSFLSIPLYVFNPLH